MTSTNFTSQLPVSTEQIIEDAKQTGQFPILYKVDSRTGRKKIWKIMIDEKDIDMAIVYVEHGFIDGKIHQEIPEVYNGTETKTAYQLALAKAVSKFRRKIKTYSVDHNTNTSNIIYPMLAKDYKSLNARKNIVFPAVVQRKYDGVRCIATYNGTSVKMYSKSMKPIHQNIPHIVKELLNFFTDRIALIKNPKNTLFVDGEIYAHGMMLQKINGFVSRKMKSEDPDLIKLQYHIFDCFFTDNLSVPYIDRFQLIKQILENNKYKYLVKVETKVVNNHEEVQKYLEQFSKEGYEGLIIRNIYGKYKYGAISTNRSSDIQKYKLLEEEEFKIVDIIQAPENKDFGIIIYVIIENGSKVPVNGSGTLDYRKYILENKNKYIGKYIRVRYHGRTSDNIPRYMTPIIKSSQYIFINEK